jgi:hypothetical protein
VHTDFESHKHPVIFHVMLTPHSHLHSHTHGDSAVFLGDFKHTATVTILVVVFLTKLQFFLFLSFLYNPSILLLHKRRKSSSRPSLLNDYHKSRLVGTHGVLILCFLVPGDSTLSDGAFGNADLGSYERLQLNLVRNRSMKQWRR